MMSKTAVFVQFRSDTVSENSPVRTSSGLVRKSNDNEVGVTCNMHEINENYLHFTQWNGPFWRLRR